MSKDIKEINEIYEKLTKEIEDLNIKLTEIKEREDKVSSEYNESLNKEQEITNEKRQIVKKKNALSAKIVSLVVTIPMSIIPILIMLALICSVVLSASLVANINIDIIPKAIITLLGGVTSTGLFTYLTYHFGFPLLEKLGYRLGDKISNLKKFERIQVLEEKEKMAKEERTNKYVELQEIYKEKNKCNENIRLRRKFLEYLDEELSIRSLNTSSNNLIQEEKNHHKVRILSLEKN